MRAAILVSMAAMGLGLSACSQVSNVFSKKPHTHAADGTVILTDTSLRSTPQQDYQFADNHYDVEIYSNASQYPSYSSQYSGYAVDLYDQHTAYTHHVMTDPREAEFVKLNGTSEATDWQNCETRHKGYLYLSEYDFSLNPGFEVCMRNKGYVLTTEAGPTSKQVLSAKTAGLRSYSQPHRYLQPYEATSPTGYIRPTYNSASELDFMR